MVHTGVSYRIGLTRLKSHAEAGTDMANLCEETRDRAEEQLDEVRGARLGPLPRPPGRHRQARGPHANDGTTLNTTVRDTNFSAWDRMIRMNLTGAFPSCQAVARFMIRRWPEAIINVGSLSARIGNNRQKQTRFSAATAVVHLLTKCLAVEWAPHSIWVNALLPGGIHNGLLDPNVTRDQQHVEEYWRNPAAQDWFGRPEELASTVAYRSPDASTLLTSGEMAVCGGFSCADIPQEALS